MPQVPIIHKTLHTTALATIPPRVTHPNLPLILHATLMPLPHRRMPLPPEPVLVRSSTSDQTHLSLFIVPQEHLPFFGYSLQETANDRGIPPGTVQGFGSVSQVC